MDCIRDWDDSGTSVTLSGLTIKVHSLSDSLSSVVAFAQWFFRIKDCRFYLAGLNRFLDSSKPMVNTARTKGIFEGSVILNTTFKLKKILFPSKFTAKVGQKTC